VAQSGYARGIFFGVDGTQFVPRAAALFCPISALCSVAAAITIPNISPISKHSRNHIFEPASDQGFWHGAGFFFSFRNIGGALWVTHSFGEHYFLGEPRCTPAF
jgi:hypothetical protein